MDRLEFLNKELGTDLISINDIDWHYISKHQKLSENFIREFQDKVYWTYISCHQKLSEKFIIEFQDKINWTRISISQKLSDGFIREFQDYVNWFWISTSQKLSEEFIREFQHKIDWYNISSFQKLSEDFIKEFQDKIDWCNISKYQKLSENLIIEFKDKVNWSNISKYQKLSPEFIKEFKIKIDKDNWLYKTTEFKKNKIVKFGKYECYEDYFIAYKSIRNDRYSHYNFQYQYLPNEIYEAHCDCTNDANSFGLSVWGKKQSHIYNNSGLVIKVKIKYEDIGRFITKGKKIRCFKIEVLE